MFLALSLSGGSEDQDSSQVHCWNLHYSFQPICIWGGKYQWVISHQLWHEMCRKFIYVFQEVRLVFCHRDLFFFVFLDRALPEDVLSLQRRGHAHVHSPGRHAGRCTGHRPLCPHTAVLRASAFSVKELRSKPCSCLHGSAAAAAVCCRGWEKSTCSIYGAIYFRIKSPLLLWASENICSYF